MNLALTLCSYALAPLLGLVGLLPLLPLPDNASATKDDRLDALVHGESRQGERGKIVGVKPSATSPVCGSKDGFG